MTKAHEIPVIVRIERNDDTEKLYKLEHARDIAFRAAADELGRVLRHDKSDYWPATVPAALLNVLETYETGASLAAALGFLQFILRELPEALRSFVAAHTTFFETILDLMRDREVVR